MDDFRLIFYIGIAIAWFVYKNYQKVQQNRPKKTEPLKEYTAATIKEPQPVKTAIEKLKQQKQIIQSGNKKDSKTFKKTEPSKTVLKDESKKKTVEISPFLETGAIHPSIQTFSDSKNDTEINKEIRSEDLFDLRKFDIRSAIIYSEILKRPQL